MLVRSRPKFGCWRSLRQHRCLEVDRLVDQRVNVKRNDLVHQLWVGSEDLGAMLAVLESGKLRTRIAGNIAGPAHDGKGVWVVLIIRGGGREDRDVGAVRNEVVTGNVGGAGEQNQRLDLRMALGELH